MATLRQYYDTDFPHVFNAVQDITVAINDHKVDFRIRVHYHFFANATFLTAFVPENEFALDVCKAIVSRVPVFLDSFATTLIRGGMVGERQIKSENLKFTGRVFLYCENQLSDCDIDTIEGVGSSINIVPQFRGPRYMSERSRLERPIAFISHDSRDKDAIARPLAEELSKRMCPVWFDEFSLRPGDSLRESIEKGLKECKKCVLIISRHFLSNSGWTKAEFNAIFTRELLEQQVLFVPVWCNVDQVEVFNYSPTLKDRYAVKWNDDAAKVASAIRRVID